MKISYIEPIGQNKKQAERIFGCSYTNYAFPNIYILIIFALLEKKYKVFYNQNFLYFKDDNSFKDFISSDESDIYLIFSVNLSMETDIAFAKRILEIEKDKIIIFLGPAPTFFTDKFVINKNTYVVRGEPDITTIDLIDTIVNKKPLEDVKGISYFEQSEKQGSPAQSKGASYFEQKKIVHNETRGIIDNLDSLPFPARYLIKKNNFYNPKLGLKPFTIMFTSRGCPHRCIYCVPCALSFCRELEFKKTNKIKPPVRLRSASNIIEEFKLLKKEGYKSISIIDDQFVLGKERILEICSGIKDLNLVWGCLSRADHLDEEIVKALKEAGCKYVDIGVESFEQEILNYTKKDEAVEKLIEGINLLKKYKIFVKLNILFGSSPLETKETIKKTLEEIKKISPDQVMFNVCSPFPGTEFYNIAKEQNWIIGGKYSPVDVARSANINYPHLSNKELQDIVYKANLQFFLSPKFIFKNIVRLKNPFYIFEAIKANLKKLFQ